MVKTNKVCTKEVRCIEFLKGLEKRNRVNRTEKLMEKKDFLLMDIIKGRGTRGPKNYDLVYLYVPVPLPSSQRGKLNPSDSELNVM